MNEISVSVRSSTILGGKRIDKGDKRMMIMGIVLVAVSLVLWQISVNIHCNITSVFWTVGVIISLVGLILLIIGALLLILVPIFVYFDTT